MNRDNVLKAGIFVALVTLCVAARTMTHLPNFTPMASAALFAGFYFHRRAVAFFVPLLAVTLSDLIIGGYSPMVMAAVYASHTVPVLLGIWLAKRTTPLRVGGTAVGSAVLFFTVTNFFHWLSPIGTEMFGRSASGLLACYMGALPFFRHTLLGNLFWCTILFGGYAMVTQLVETWELRRLQPVPVRKRK